MKKSSTGRSMFFCIITVFLAFAVVFIAFQLKREKEYKIAMLNVQLQDINADLYRDVSRDSTADFGSCLGEYAVPHLRLTVVDTLGKVLYDNVERDYESMPGHLEREEVSSAIRTGSGYVIDRLSETTHTKYFYSATYFPDRGIVIRTALPYDHDLRDMLKADIHFIWVALAVVLILVVVLRIYVKIFDSYIARQKDLEKALTRRQMTQNISHELKTPVAGIRGYLETLADNPQLDADTRQEFIQRSLSQAGRLTSLLDDISILNRIDDAPEGWVLEDVDVSQMVQTMVSDMSEQIAAKGMTFHNLLPFGIRIHGNYSLIYSIFRNLTDNAIAYAGQGAKITLSACEESTCWAFTFRDNGPGVPEEHISHIFERFYRVDKGRSRSLGGTGLGLSIVKNAVLFHGGTIAASNDGGLKLDFTLKKK